MAKYSAGDNTRVINERYTLHYNEKLILNIQCEIDKGYEIDALYIE